ncbi:hypothetical protein ACTZWT_19915 [Rhodopseudomonas sp. NSM]|uniref:hypothetical protein n=1 Tax=Rhodopseudomonas sp. NSM TaxID=3457630 RepID=UPI0040374F88
MKRLVCIIAGLILPFSIAAAAADTCSKSHEYLLNSGDLTRPAKAYNDLFRTCLAAGAMSNVKDAYVLKDGGIGVLPKQDTIPATAGTLSQFCDAFPRATLHFFTRRERAQIGSMASIVRISSTSSTSCQKIKGLAE